MQNDRQGAQAEEADMPHTNRVKAAMREGRVAYGYNLAFPAPWVVDILAGQPFDFVWLDGEHGPFGLEQLEHMCRAAEAAGVTPIARVPDIRASTILRFLDRGIQGILGPHIASAADAEELVRSCTFGPRGERSFGGNRGTDYNQGIDDKAEYYRIANDNMLIGALLEDAGVVDNLDAILAVEGIDACWIGPGDLSASMGTTPGTPEHTAAIRSVIAACHKTGKIPGISMGDVEVARFWIDEGCRFVTCGDDGSWMTSGARAALVEVTRK